jgi:YfiH family protein
VTFGPDFSVVEAGGLLCLRSDSLRVSGVVHAFTTRQSLEAHLDPLADAAVRRRVLRSLGFDPRRVVTLDQRHTAHVVEAGPHDAGRRLGVADAVVTSAPGVALSVCTADCLPVLLADPEAKIVAAAHAGWRGLSDGILLRTVEAMAVRGARPGRILAAIGPSVGPCCYEVDAPVVEAMGPWLDGALPPTRPGHWMLDLRAVALRQLRAAGLAAHRVSCCPACTACHPDWFFSYRRDRRTGRMEALIALTSSSDRR